MKTVLTVVLFIVAAPLAGGLMAGLDRKAAAWMQSRVGPPLLQPFYDVAKLFSKQNIAVHKSQKYYVLCFLVFVILSGALFVAGQDLLLVIFALTLADVFLILGAYSVRSPYSYVGAERELVQMMAYEPMVIITAIGMYMVTKSFSVADIVAFEQNLFVKLPGIFIGLLFVLTGKLRKSPFDLSLSRHAHQEIVGGVLTEFSGAELAMVKIAYWYQNVFLLGLVYLFFAPALWLGVGAVMLTFFLEVFIDNNSARLTWQFTLASAWIAAAVLGMGNLVVLVFI